MFVSDMSKKREDRNRNDLNGKMAGEVYLAEGEVRRKNNSELLRLLVSLVWRAKK